MAEEKEYAFMTCHLPGFVPEINRIHHFNEAESPLNGSPTPSHSSVT